MSVKWEYWFLPLLTPDHYSRRNAFWMESADWSHFLLSLLLWFINLQCSSLVQHQQAHWEIGLEWEEHGRIMCFLFLMAFPQPLLPPALWSTMESNLHDEASGLLSERNLAGVGRPGSGVYMTVVGGRELQLCSRRFIICSKFFGVKSRLQWWLFHLPAEGLLWAHFLICKMGLIVPAPSVSMRPWEGEHQKPTPSSLSLKCLKAWCS